MGFVDRGGGREAKGSSLRRSKKNPGAPSTKNKSKDKNYTVPAVRVLCEAPPACEAAVATLRRHADSTQSDEEIFAEMLRELKMGAAGTVPALPAADGAVSLLSRRLEEEMEGVLERAKGAGLSALLCYCAERERQGHLVEVCRAHNNLQVTGKSSGEKKVRFADPATDASLGAANNNNNNNSLFLYSLVGVHVNNIDRMNKKMQAQWIEELSSQEVKYSSVLGILSGLNLRRDSFTHFWQENMLRASYRLAAAERLPLVLFLHSMFNQDSAAAAAPREEDVTIQKRTVDRAVEILEELFSGKSEEGEGAAEADTTAATGHPPSVVIYDALPLLHCSAALQKFLLKYRPHFRTPATPEAVDEARPAVYAMLTANGITTTPPAAEGAEAGDGEGPRVTQDAWLPLLPRLPFDAPHPTVAAAAAETSFTIQPAQLLLASGSPWHTPQNIDDSYVRGQFNEPSNMADVARAIAAHVVKAAANTSSVEGATEESVTRQLSHVSLLNFTNVFFHHVVSASASQQQQHEASVDPHLHKAVPVSVDGGKNTKQHDSGKGKGGGDDDDEMRELLAQAAREREAFEREREAAENSNSDDDDGGRRRKERKKNVKANNRSNFTHFRNKDFAPRQTKAEKLAHMKKVGERSDSDDDDAHHATTTAAAAEREEEPSVPVNPSSAAARRQQKKKKRRDKRRDAENEHGAATQAEHRSSDDDDDDRNNE